MTRQTKTYDLLVKALELVDDIRFYNDLRPEQESGFWDLMDALKESDQIKIIGVPVASVRNKEAIERLSN